ncbi:hypothetical protein FACS1894216_15180 [Synergistales bacterium]|nr:hypothetical protein FACS1894216_15180 [Synergistales bacterium]
MKTVETKNAIANAKKYLSGNVRNPFFIVVDDAAEYAELKTGLETLSVMRVSDFCAEADVYPNIDALCDRLSSVAQNTLLLGLGEIASLCNLNILSRIKDISLASKVIILCRSVRKVIKDMYIADRKWGSRHVCFLKPGMVSKIIKFPSHLSINANHGFKALLYCLENGADDNLYAKTELLLQGIVEVGSAYDALRQLSPLFALPQTCLPGELWTEYFSDKNLDGFGLLHWRTFIKLKLELPSNVYHKYVLDTSADYGVYKKRLFSALLDFQPDSKQFAEMYNSRKTLLKELKDSDIAAYVTETKIKGSERIHYLTDNTQVERQAVIECLNGQTSVPEIIKEIYPAIYEYLRVFSFTGEKGGILTEYFTEYKQLKLTNRIPADFHDKVLAFAIDGNRPYNSLSTRGEVLDRIDKTNASLYWIDALGVEYLGYIQNRANTLGLQILVHTVRANLPTITSFNNDFYQAWNGDKMQTKELDEIKHDGERDFNYQTIKEPVHIAEELRILDSVLDWAKTKLAGKKADKVIIISDHGASRLAVISEQENKYEMASKGEHSGRCCPCSEADVKSEYATEENGFWVLANYGRFKGGRKASVEVHGGATLEEVVVPLIELSLFGNKIEITNTTPVTTRSFRKNADIVLFSVNVLKKVSVLVGENRYDAEAIGDNKHKITFPDIKRAGKHSADVYEGDNLIGQVTFEIRLESVKENDLF